MPVRQSLRRSGSPTQPDHQGKHPEQHFRPFRGILQADAFNGYDRLFSAGREGGALTEGRMLGSCATQNPRCIYQYQKRDSGRSPETNR
ncbi:truncated transposase [Escherichia coli]|nr:truncated transposase [Escherichia coli]